MEHGARRPPGDVPLLIAGICFILALRGLSSPVSSRRGNRFGMFGMVLAVGTTLFHYRPLAGPAGPGWLDNVDMLLFGEVVAAIALGAAIGLVTARRIAMTAMPQLSAAFHSLVGMAAVLWRPPLPQSERSASPPPA